MICPASSMRTRVYLRSIGQPTEGLPSRSLERRASRIYRHRQLGEIATAERFGWISLAGIILGVPGAENCQAPEMLTAVEGIGMLKPPVSSEYVIPGLGIEVEAAIDADGYWLFQLAAESGSVTSLGGRQVATEGLKAGLSRTIYDWCPKVGFNDVG